MEDLLMKTYVSDIITCDVIKKLEAGQNYLIGSEMGSGKNYWVRNTLLPYTVENKKKVLLVVHRTAVKGQQTKYLQPFVEDCIRTFKGVGFKVCSYQSIEQIIKHGRSDLIDEYDYIICDEAHYFVKDSIMNPNIVYFYEYLDNNDRAIKVFATGTYKSFSYLKWRNKLIYLKHADYNNSNVKEIYCYRDTIIIESLIEEKISMGQKVVMIVGNKKTGQAFKERINVKSCFVTADHKECSEFLKIIEDNTFESDFLIATSLICEGVELKKSGVKTMVIDEIEDLETIAQCPARVRDDEVVLFINQPTYQKLVNRSLKYENKLDLIDEFEQLGYLEYEQKYGYETIHQSHDFILTSQRQFADRMENELILKLNPCVMANYEYQYDMYQTMIEVGFEHALKEYFPRAVIYNYDELIKNDFIRKKLISDFMNRPLFKEEQQKLKGLLIREYGFRKSLGINQINENLKTKHLNLQLRSGREESRKSANYKKTYWILEEAA